MRLPRLTSRSFLMAAVLLAAPSASAYTPTHTFGPSPTPTATGTARPPQAVIAVTPNPARSGQRVLLDGSATLGTRDFQWTQVGGDVTVEIEDAGATFASFVVPPLESPVEVTIQLGLKHGSPDQAVVTLLPSDTVRVEVGSVTGAPGTAVDVEIEMRTLGYEVTALDHELGFDRFAAVAEAGGAPACRAGDDLAIDSASFTFLPEDCTPGVDCAAVRAAIVVREPILDGAITYRCTVDIDDGEAAPSCSHPLTCGKGEARTNRGDRLDLDCIGGGVTAEYSVRPVDFELVADPSNPIVGDPVRLSVRAIGDGGLPAYSLLDAAPFLRGVQSPQPSNGPLGEFVEFEALADCPGVAPVRIHVNYETRCGCASQSSFCFTGMTSEPLPVVVRARDGFTVSGLVTEFPLCSGAQRGATVTLEPLGFTTQTDLSSGTFHFDGVPPGDYTLTVSPSCNPFGCWAPQTIRVENGDVDVTICPESVSPTLTPTITPTDVVEATATPTATSTSTPTNPPGSCCGERCGGLSFPECQAAAKIGDCEGWGDPCLECGEIPGSVSVVGFEVEPPLPRVGDVVTLRFDLEVRTFSVEGVELKGASPFLEEITRSDTTFEAIASRAGKPSVSLEVAYRNEIACTDGFGNTYYSPGPLRTSTSQQYEIEIAEAPTPTSTVTQTPAPTDTPNGNGGDGCQLDPGASNPGSPWWCLVLVLVARRRCRSDVDASHAQRGRLRSQPPVE